ncbi:MAG TPA: hypothetical protein VIW24_27920 [Aldersonia sp.]
MAVKAPTARRRASTPVVVDDEDLAAAFDVPALAWWTARFGSARDLAAEMDEAVEHVRRPRRPQVIACLGGKGGAGKTTNAAGSGSVFAGVLRERAIVVDANPDVSTLALRMPRRDDVRPLHAIPSAGQLLDDSDLRPFLVHNRLGLDAVLSRRRRDLDTDYETYRHVLSTLSGNYRMILADCGTSLASGAARAVLERATQFVLVTPAKVDGFYALLETIDELEAAGYGDVVANSVATINGVVETSPVDIDRFHATLVKRCRGVYRIPFDQHLDAGAVLDFAALQPETKVAYTRLAAAVSARFR